MYYVSLFTGETPGFRQELISFYNIHCDLYRDNLFLRYNMLLGSYWYDRLQFNIVK